MRAPKKTAANKPPKKKAAAPKATAEKKPSASKKEERVYDDPLHMNPKGKKPDRIFFGVGGVPHSAKERTHPGAVRRLSEIGLDVYEMEFVHGVRIRPESCAGVNKAQRETGVRVTAHGPYYINLYSMEEEKLEASRKRVLDTAYALADCGGDGACFHAGFYQKRDPDEVYRFMRDQIADLAAVLEKDGCPVRLDPETTGKGSQFGSLDELTVMAGELKKTNVGITVDFSHVHARSGGRENTYEEFASQLERIKNRMGKAALASMHIHLSGIAYTEKGERNHLELDESDMNYKDLFRALIDFGAEGRVVCESPALEYDALIMQKTYRKLNGS
ncbi:MAG: TIM barrel protein [bacterium]|nr:TIM barrel protein [bacterium]